MNHAKVVGERDKARDMYRALAKDILEAYFQTCPKEWAYSDPHQALNNIVDYLKQERDAARRWAAAWKRAAKANKARHLHDVIKYKLKYRTAVKERDEARAQLANAAASEVDAVQGRQERELREARKRIETLEAERVLWADAFMGRWEVADFDDIVRLAKSIQEDAA